MIQGPQATGTRESGAAVTENTTDRMGLWLPGSLICFRLITT